MIKKLKLWAVAIASVFLFTAGTVTSTQAATRDQGVDWSVYQGNQGKFGYASDKFAIPQLAGIYNQSVKVQSTYATQIQYATAEGKRTGTYFYLADGANTDRTTQQLSALIPKIQSPKKSVVAIDYEESATSDKAANTANVMAAMKLVKDAGYTPLVYSYAPYLKAHLDYNKILATYPNSIWIAAYPNYNVTSKPNYNIFPSLPGVAMYQFTSMYVAGGLDGDVDLLGVTMNGYSKGDNDVADTTTPAIKAGEEADNTAKADIKTGDTVKVNFCASKWATGQKIASFVKGQPYKVAKVNGSRLLLSGVNSWINRSDVEILSVGAPVTTKPTAGLTVDGKLGYKTILAGQKLYDMRIQDGKISRPSQYIRILQKHLGVKQDGYMGPQTIKAMQRRLGVRADGILGPQTIKAWQRAINAGTKF